MGGFVLSRRDAVLVFSIVKKASLFLVVTILVHQFHCINEFVHLIICDFLRIELKVKI